MSELTSVASLTEAVLRQRIQENRRELKRRIESLRVRLWTTLEVLDNGLRLFPSPIADYVREIDALANQTCNMEQTLEQLRDLRVESPIVSIDELRPRGTGIGVPA